MTREEAIQLLNTLVAFKRVDAPQEEIVECIKMAIKSLEQEPCVEWHDIPSDEMTLEQSRQAVKDLRKKLAKCLEQAPTPKWIPVSERLPEEGEDVLVCYEYFRYGDYNCMQTTYGVGNQYNGRWGGDVRGHKLNVFAWHPLPEPYKGEADKMKEIGEAFIKGFEEGFNSVQSKRTTFTEYKPEKEGE